MSAGQLLTPVSDMTLAEAAQHYASQGVPVFPCVPGEKRPLVAHGFHDRPPTPGRLRRGGRNGRMRISASRPAPRRGSRSSMST